MVYHDHLIRSVRLCILIINLALSFEALMSEEELFLFLPTHFELPPPCPTNEMYKSCLGNCSNCQLRGSCLLDGCHQSGCDCVPHFVRLTPGAPCEPIYNCPVPECGENEVFRECGPLCEKCGTLRCRILHCEHKCYCKEGYLRDLEGKCIAEDDCPPKNRCPREEEKAESGLVDEYCQHAEDEEVSNATESKERCYCKEGFKRNSMGHCMHDKYCPVIKCMNFEVYQLCPKKCNTTCRNYGDLDCEEDRQCYPGCFCPEGYLMNDYRICVRLEECPPGSNPFAPTAGPTTTPAITESTLPENGNSSPLSTSDRPTTESATSQTTRSTISQTTQSLTTIKDYDEHPTDEEYPEEDIELTTEVSIQTPSVSTTATTRKPKPTKRARAGKEERAQKVDVTTPKTTTPAEDLEEDNE